MSKTAKIVEETKAKNESHTSKRRTQTNPRSLANLRMWKPGQSGNPGGRPKHDLSAEIARAIFEQNPEMIYQSFGKLLRNGSAYGFQVLSDRAFGKLRERVDIVDMTDVVKKLQQGRERLKKKQSA